MKTTFLQIRVSESEKKALEILSENKGISMSDYVRMKIKDDMSDFVNFRTGRTQVSVEAFASRG